jgi:hypothetical protein
MVKTAGGSAQVAGARILKDGLVWTGSFVSATYGSNNTNAPLVTVLSERIVSGSTFNIQVASDINLNFTAQLYPISTLVPATITYSGKVMINRQ